MPRESASSVATTALRLDVGRPQRIATPRGLPDDVRRIFEHIIDSVKPEHFKPVDTDLLVEFATAVALARRAAAAIEAEGAVIGGKTSPWVVVQEKSVRSIVALSMRLRIAPQSRYDVRQASRNANDRSVVAGYSMTRRPYDDGE